MTRRRILLVFPPSEGEVRDRVTPPYYKNPVVKYMPLGILTLAAVLRDDHDVTVLDASSKGLSLEETVHWIEAREPEVVGISAVTYRAWAVRELLRRLSAPVKVVGGPHATANAATLLAQGAHAVFIGDGEATFPAWLAAGMSPGIFPGEATDPDACPFPAREMVDLEDYRILPDDNLLFSAGSLRLPMFSSKGCPFRCNFCDVQEKRFRFKSPERVVAEFREILGLGATSVHILDDCFNVRGKRVRQIAAGLAEAGIVTDWSARGMVERDERVIAALAAAGCRRLHVGLEHLDDGILAFFRKQYRFRHIEEFCEMARRYGIEILGYFILGAPGETAAIRERLIADIERLGIRYPFFNILSPLPGTDYYRGLLHAGTLGRDDWADFIAAPTPNWRMPSGRDPQTDAELHEGIAKWTAHFRALRER
ncbi:MAG: B12-binding domain-containing radical SAM protein [Magnetococcales bacterium]|nr:B12-binding domain-containing radical SAM protein [Magnetococcales bacterium]